MEAEPRLDVPDASAARGRGAGDQRRTERKRVYTINDAGRAELQERRERGGEEPWDFGPLGEGPGQLRYAGFQLAAAAMQVARTGSEAQRKQAAEVLAEARKKLYALLAEG